MTHLSKKSRRFLCYCCPLDNDIQEIPFTDGNRGIYLSYFPTNFIDEITRDLSIIHMTEVSARKTNISNGLPKWTGAWMIIVTDITNKTHIDLTKKGGKGIYIGAIVCHFKDVKNQLQQIVEL